MDFKLLFNKYLINYKIQYQNTTTWFIGNYSFGNPVFKMKITQDGDVYYVNFYKICKDNSIEDCDHYWIPYYVISSDMNYNSIPYIDSQKVFKNYYKTVRNQLSFVDWKNIHTIDRDKIVTLLLAFKRYKIPNEMVLLILSFIRIIKI